MNDDRKPASGQEQSGADRPKAPRLDAAKIDVPGWHQHVMLAPSPREESWRHFSLWLASEQQYGPDASVAAVEILETSSASDARALAHRCASDCEIAALNSDATIGDLAWVGERGMPVIFAVGPFAASVTQAERGPIPAMDVAQAVAAHLAGMGS